MFCAGADRIPVSAIPLIHRSCSNRALLRGSHITGWARYIVIWYHWRTHWLQCAIGRVTPTQEKHTYGSNFRQRNTPKTLGKALKNSGSRCSIGEDGDSTIQSTVSRAATEKCHGLHRVFSLPFPLGNAQPGWPGGKEGLPVPPIFPSYLTFLS